MKGFKDDNEVLTSANESCYPRWGDWVEQNWKRSRFEHVKSNMHIYIYTYQCRYPLDY